MPVNVKDGSKPAGPEAKSGVGGSRFVAVSGRVAQLVEQRTENPCVGGSIPSPATIPFKELRHFRKTREMAFV
jgi:hypothetical protein